MNNERLAALSRIFIILAGSLFLGYLFVGHLLLLVLPFLIAWAIAFAVRPVSKKLSSRLHISERIARTAFATLVCVGVLLIVFVFVWRLVLQGWRILSSLGESDAVFRILERVSDPEGLFMRSLPKSLGEALSHALLGALERLAGAFTDFAAGFVGGIPSAFLFILVTIISTIYFAFDLERINSFLQKRLPARAYGILVKFKNSFFTVGVRYIRAYFIIMLMIFTMVFIGLLLLGVKYAFVISVLVAVLDILPVIGVGTVLIPWGIFNIFFGSRSLGIGLIVLFVTVEFVRQLTEPKIVGKHLGLHPIVSLVLLWGAYRLFGILGVLMMPAIVVVINSVLNKNDPPKIKKRTVHKADRPKS